MPLENGTRLGPYEIVGPIGAGGMGVVYVAEQAEPVQRKVALKIIRPGMASKEVPQNPKTPILLNMYKRRNIFSGLIKI